MGDEARVARGEGLEVISKWDRGAVRRSLHRMVRSLVWPEYHDNAAVDEGKYMRRCCKPIPLEEN